MGDINITGDYLKNGEKIGLWEGSYNDGWSIEAAGVDYNGVHYKGAKIRINTGSVDYYNGFAAGGWIEFIAGESSDERRAGAIFMEDPDDTENFVIIKNGKLGIKHQPYNGDAELTVNGDARITGKLYVDNFWQQREEGLFYHYKDKKICIGTYNFNNDGLLNVNGKINAEEIEIIDVYPADFVFDTDYNLKSIDQLEEYIKKNKKLPDIPSGKEMQKNGMNIAKMNGLLLQKIEELTLYMIELKKENEKLKEQNEKIKEVMREIEKLKAENK